MGLSVRDLQQQGFKNAVVDLFDETLRERQRQIGIALHDVGAVEHDRLAAGERRDGARLQEPHIAALHGVFHVRRRSKQALDRDAKIQ